MSGVSSIRRLPRDGLSPVEAEAAIAALSIERLYVFDRDGRQIARFEGEEGFVFHDLSPAERERARDGLLVHNHPPHVELPPDDPRYDSDSFSPADWETAVDLNVEAIIAVSPTWRHTLIRPAAGWLAKYHPGWHLREMLISRFDFLTEADEKRVEAGQATTSETRAMVRHRVNQDIAAEIGAVYRRERRL